MPRQPRLDAPGVLHHVMGRGIERTIVFRDDGDRTDFVNRLATLARAGNLVVYAWALMPNHFHLLVRTGQWPLFRSMKGLLTGYVVNFSWGGWSGTGRTSPWCRPTSGGGSDGPPAV